MTTDRATPSFGTTETGFVIREASGRLWGDKWFFHLREDAEAMIERLGLAGAKVVGARRASRLRPVTTTTGKVMVDLVLDDE